MYAGNPFNIVDSKRNKTYEYAIHILEVIIYIVILVVTIVLDFIYPTKFITHYINYAITRFFETNELLK